MPHASPRDRSLSAKGFVNEAPCAERRVAARIYAENESPAAIAA